MLRRHLPNKISPPFPLATCCCYSAVKYFHSFNNKGAADSSSLTPLRQQQEPRQQKSSFLYEEPHEHANDTHHRDSLSISSRQTISANLQQQQTQDDQVVTATSSSNTNTFFTSDDPSSKYQHSASEDFFSNVDKKRKFLKPTMQQLEFPSGMTERVTAASSSRVGALYQLHYSDTNVREVIYLRGVGTFPVKLQGLSQDDFLEGKIYLEKEAAGTISNNNGNSNQGGGIQKFDREISNNSENRKNQGNQNSSSSSSSGSSDDDMGFLFTLYIENIPTDGALNTIAARFSARKSDLITLAGYGKEQCTTQIAFAKINSISKEQILSINHMRFPGFCIKTSILYRKQKKNNKNSNNNKNDMIFLTRREFSVNSSHDASKEILAAINAKNLLLNKNNINNTTNDDDQEADDDFHDRENDNMNHVAPLDHIRLIRNEVTTLLRRVQVAGHEESLRSVLEEIRDKGAINYYSPIAQEAPIVAFRRLQTAKFKSAVLQLLLHKNMHPALRTFVKDPTQNHAAAARRAIGNEQARGLLRTYIETNSFYRTIEAAPGSLKGMLWKTARRLAWNTMASKRIRSETVNHFVPGPVRVQLRVGDFVVIKNELRCRSNRRVINTNDAEDQQQKETNEKKHGEEQEEEEEEFTLSATANDKQNIKGNSTLR